jgi:hypothetical protein
MSRMIKNFHWWLSGFPIKTSPRQGFVLFLLRIPIGLPTSLVIQRFTDMGLFYNYRVNKEWTIGLNG